MKRMLKISIIVIVVLVVLYFVTGFILNAVHNYNRTKNLKLNEDTIAVTNDNYYNYLEEIYVNGDKYINREIVIEGVYSQTNYNDKIYHFVGKHIEHEHHSDDEECEDSHLVGIEFEYENGKINTGDYIEVKGILTSESDDEGKYLVLKNCTVRTDIPEGAKTIQ